MRPYKIGAETKMILADRIASAVIEQYNSLKPRGKPQGREWTVLAGIVAQDTRVSLPLPLEDNAWPRYNLPLLSHLQVAGVYDDFVTALADSPLPRC